MTRMPIRLASLSLGIGLLLAQLDAAGTSRAVWRQQIRVIDLRNKQEALQQTVLSQQNRITELSDALARANGQIEQLNRQVSELKADQANGYKALDERLRALEPIPTEQLIQQSFDTAVSLTQNGDYAKPTVRGRSTSNPTPIKPIMPMCNTGTGVAQYGAQSYRNAITRLQTFMQQYPQDERIPHAMLTIGSAQIASGQKPPVSPRCNN